MGSEWFHPSAEQKVREKSSKLIVIFMIIRIWRIFDDCNDVDAFRDDGGHNNRITLIRF